MKPIHFVRAADAARAVVFFLLLLASSIRADALDQIKDRKVDDKTVAQWLEVASNKRLAGNDREAALKKVGTLGQDVVPLVVEYISSDDSNKEYQARVIAYSVGKPAAPALVELLEHSNKGVVEEVHSTLVNMKGNAVDAVVEGLGHKSAVRREFCARILGQIGEPAKGAGPALQKLANDPDPRVKKSVIWAMGVLGVADDKAAASALEDPDKSVRAAAVQALGRAPATPAAVDVLNKALADEDTMVLGYAVEVAAKWGPAAGPVLEQLAKIVVSQDSKLEGGNTRGDACRAMGKIGPPALPILTKFLQHEEKNVRHWALDAIGQIGPKAADAAPAVVKLLETTKDERERSHVLSTLLKMGGALADEVDHLETLLPQPAFSDKQGELRQLIDMANQSSLELPEEPWNPVAPAKPLAITPIDAKGIARLRALLDEQKKTLAASKENQRSKQVPTYDLIDFYARIGDIDTAKALADEFTDVDGTKTFQGHEMPASMLARAGHYAWRTGDRDGAGKLWKEALDAALLLKPGQYHSSQVMEWLAMSHLRAGDLSGAAEVANATPAGEWRSAVLQSITIYLIRSGDLENATSAALCAGAKEYGVYARWNAAKANARAGRAEAAVALYGKIVESAQRGGAVGEPVVAAVRALCRTGDAAKLVNRLKRLPSTQKDEMLALAADELARVGDFENADAAVALMAPDNYMLRPGGTRIDAMIEIASGRVRQKKASVADAFAPLHEHLVRLSKPADGEQNGRRRESDSVSRLLLGWISTAKARAALGDREGALAELRAAEGFVKDSKEILDYDYEASVKGLAVTFAEVGDVEHAKQVLTGAGLTPEGLAGIDPATTQPSSNDPYGRNDIAHDQDRKSIGSVYEALAKGDFANALAAAPKKSRATDGSGRSALTLIAEQAFDAGNAKVFEECLKRMAEENRADLLHGQAARSLELNDKAGALKILDLARPILTKAEPTDVLRFTVWDAVLCAQAGDKAANERVVAALKLVDAESNAKSTTTKPANPRGQEKPQTNDGLYQQLAYAQVLAGQDQAALTWLKSKSPDLQKGGQSAVVQGMLKRFDLDYDLRAGPRPWKWELR